MNLSKLFIGILFCVFTLYSTYASITAVQVINNLPYPTTEKMTVALNQVDYTSGGMSFGKGINFIPTTTTDMISITHPEITDLNVSFPASSSPCIYIFTGVKDVAKYSNPYNRTISIDFIPNSYTGKLSSSGTGVYFTIYHGSTDAPQVKLYNYDDDSYWTKGLDFKKASGYPYTGYTAKDYTIDVIDYNKDTVIATFDVNLTNYAGKPFCMVLGGFLDSTKNQNGPGLTLYGVFVDGSSVIFPRVKTQTHTNTSIPTLVYPANGITNANYTDTLRWNKVSKAKSYKVQMSIYSDFTNCLSNDSNITDTFYVYDGLASNKLFYWHVASVTTSGSSSWSEPFTLTTKPDAEKPTITTLSSPALNATKINLVGKFEWNSVVNANYYYLQVSKKNSFEDLVLDKNNLKNNYYEYTVANNEQLELNTKYFWRVKAGNSAGTSDWSDMFWFTTTDNVSILEKASSKIIAEVVPNPVTDISDLIIYPKNNSGFNLEIYSLSGNLIKKYSNNSGNDIIKIPINKNEFQSGMYFYKLMINSEVYYDKIFIAN